MVAPGGVGAIFGAYAHALLLCWCLDTPCYQILEFCSFHRNLIHEAAPQAPHTKFRYKVIVNSLIDEVGLWDATIVWSCSRLLWQIALHQLLAPDIKPDIGTRSWHQILEAWGSIWRCHMVPSVCTGFHLFVVSYCTDCFTPGTWRCRMVPRAWPGAGKSVS